jgi:hypothetical protein
MSRKIDAAKRKWKCPKKKWKYLKKTIVYLIPFNGVAPFPVNLQRGECYIINTTPPLGIMEESPAYWYAVDVKTGFHLLVRLTKSALLSEISVAVERLRNAIREYPEKYQSDVANFAKLLNEEVLNYG